MTSQLGTTILLLEDDAGIARQEQTRLERAGYHVLTAVSADDGFKMVSEENVALVVLDQRLQSGLSGLEFFGQLKASGYNLPAILVTCLEDCDVLFEAVRAGVRDFVPKTRSFLDHLEPAVNRVLEQARIERELAESRSERKRTEEERMRLVTELEAGRAHLQDADRRKDQFLAVLAHELRNPLAPISNAVQIMKVEGPSGPNFRWSMEVIESQVKQMTRMIDDLLDVSRITRGKVAVSKEPITLREVVELGVEASRPLFQDSRHNLTVSLPARPIVLDVDRARIGQVIANLLNNAAKYTDSGGQITVSAEVTAGEVVIRVCDNGIGIPPELLPRVFDPFIQADETASRSRGGLGIGLTLVRALVELHGGRVIARSAGAGRGSEFIVRLPLTPGTGRRGSEDDQSSNESAIQVPRRRVLVVDDNRNHATSLGVLLGSLGQDVLMAHDGLTAWELASQERPDLLLLDIGLPGIDGYEVARRCRSNHELDHTVMVAMTGYGKEDDHRRSREAGFIGHFVKPLKIQDLQRLLEQIGSPGPVQVGFK
jgi:signal transduction histidine kinase